MLLDTFVFPTEQEKYRLELPQNTQEKKDIRSKFLQSQFLHVQALSTKSAVSKNRQENLSESDWVEFYEYKKEVSDRILNNKDDQYLHYLAERLQTSDVLTELHNSLVEQTNESLSMLCIPSIAAPKKAQP